MLTTIVIIAVLIMSAVVHEVAHGWAALLQGDTTAQDAGRLTLNPIKHLDLFGSVIIPAVLVLSHAGFFLAWAKPVPVNPMRFKDVKFGELKVALAGPLSNFVLAGFFGIVSQLLPLTTVAKSAVLAGFLGASGVDAASLISGSMLSSIYFLSIIFVFINLMLGFFNLIPWPPLDGSRIIFPFMPFKIQNLMAKLEYSPFSLLFLFFLVYLGVGNLILTPVFLLFSLLTGFF